MLDINLIREQPDLVRAGMEKRAMDSSVVDKALKLDSQRRELLLEVEALKSERNIVSKEIGAMKDASERQAKVEASREVGDKIKVLDEQLRQIDGELHAVMAVIPNIPDEGVPLGSKEEDNVVERTVGNIPEFDFDPLPHWDLGPQLGIIDFEQGVKVTGSRFYVLSGA
ncbi:MAG: serine--tRNA ligase, partial [Anaerolineae bacterium]|nr:serine--tRNA ligase [Anaerolineae bacterium]